MKSLITIVLLSLICCILYYFVYILSIENNDLIISNSQLTQKYNALIEDDNDKFLLGQLAIVWSCVNDGWSWVDDVAAETGLYMQCDQIVVDKVEEEQYNIAKSNLEGKMNVDPK